MVCIVHGVTNYGASLVAQLVKNLPAMQKRFDSWIGTIPWRREGLPTSVVWPREFHGLYSPWGHKESDTTEQLSLHFFITDYVSSMRAEIVPCLYLNPKHLG